MFQWKKRQWNNALLPEDKNTATGQVKSSRVQDHHAMVWELFEEVKWLIPKWQHGFIKQNATHLYTVTNQFSNLKNVKWHNKSSLYNEYMLIKNFKMTSGQLLTSNGNKNNRSFFVITLIDDFGLLSNNTYHFFYRLTFYFWSSHSHKP
jgi:hypothetical protein